MPIFVHIAPANMVAHIRRAGIKRGSRGVFCMPMLADYYSTHQWARELKRRGHRTMLAISFWLDDGEPVSVGAYNTPHQTLSASEAVKTLMEADNRLGYEVIVPRAIGAREIRSVRSVPHALGWRLIQRRTANRPFAYATGAVVAKSSVSATNATRRNANANGDDTSLVQREYPTYPHCGALDIRVIIQNTEDTVRRV